MTQLPGAVEDLLRTLTPQVLGALVHRYGRFDLCEDAVQEALLAAATQWPANGVPENPRAWLSTVAARRLTDFVRSEVARRRREEADAQLEVPARPADAIGDDVQDRDDSLKLLFLCCHPALTSASQIALTLRSVGGLSTAEIAGAYFVPEATMAQRISRAKNKIFSDGLRFELPSAESFGPRLAAVLHVLYLISNEGYTASSGPTLMRVDLTAEALRLTRQVRTLLPEDGEVAGLLALMLLTEARRPARLSSDGGLIPLDAQDRSLWDGVLIHEGVALVSWALTACELGPYQVQAAIAAVHDEAPSADETDWAQVLGLYAVLEQLAPNPMITLNRAVALAEVRGPQAGLALLDKLESDSRMARHHRLFAVRAHLLESMGRVEEAVSAYRMAAGLTTSAVERRYLSSRAAKLSING